jgi:hypothetical protein
MTMIKKDVQVLQGEAAMLPAGAKALPARFLSEFSSCVRFNGACRGVFFPRGVF